ncbi:MAG: SusC/RagA family TonB-linked outer membrane protein [Clostridium sp.]|nr:SusC/RagA family TonB-linked outer membrane protein [Clostridium sp.]
MLKTNNKVSCLSAGESLGRMTEYALSYLFLGMKSVFSACMADKRGVLMAMCLWVSVGMLAQTKVKGTVISGDDNEPIIGASVMVKGHAGVGTLTDIDGNFSFEAPAGATHLEVKYVGMKTSEVKISSSHLKIVLQANVQELKDVVVTGMSKMDRRLFTGATTKLDAADIRINGVADISRSLEGRAAGVSVQNVSGTFGTAPKIRVRGATSIYGNSRPLWVVDGVILEDAVEVSADELSSGDATTLISSAIAGLNADDIESFQILKDGSATSIYGARAMAGVIVVTTKKGKAGQTSINYTGELTLRLRPNYRNFNIMNSQEQMGVYKEMEAKGWLELSALTKASSSGVYGKMYQMINTYNPATGSYGLANTQAAKNAYLQQAEFRNTDWFDELFNTNVMQNHALSISGGTERGRFYSSVSVMQDPGWTMSSKVQRYTYNGNASFDLSDYLRITLLTSDSYRKQTAPGTLSQEIDVVSGEVKRGFDINPYSYALNTSRTLDARSLYSRNYSDFNILKELDNNYIELGVTDLKFQGELNWRPKDFLDFTVLGAYRYQRSTNDHFVKDNSNQALAYRAGISPEDATIRDANPYLYTDPEDENALPQTVLPKGGIYYNNSYSVSQVDFRAIGQFNKNFNRVHMVNAMVGTEFSSVDRNAISFQGWGFCYDNGNTPFVDYNLFKQQGEENAAYYSNQWTYRRNAAFFGTATYSYAARYTLNGTIRYEGSNKLGKSRESRWLPTWNVSAAWNAHEEKWFKNPVLSHATLRLSYSLTAESGPDYVSNATAIINPYKPWRPLSSVGELGLTLEEIANSELTYEKKHEFNVGLDLGFLKNRINLTMDWYTRNNYDLIGPIYTQGVGGQNRKWANVAAMKSYGVEFMLTTKNFDQRNFSWTTDWTFSYAKNEITDLDSRAQVMDLISGQGYAKQGYPVRALFSVPFMGLNEEGLPTFINEKGELTVSDHNFQDFEHTDYLKYEGPTDPTITGGFGNQFRWKNWHANIFITYSFGNVVRLDPVFSASYTDLSAMPKEFKNRWTKPGDEAVTSIPVIASKRQFENDNKLSYAYNAYNYSTARIAKGDFIRMKEISLTYDVPKTFIQKLKLSSASLKLQAVNCFLIYADKKLNGQDPEFFNSGGVATPSPKQFTFTLRLGL